MTGDNMHRVRALVRPPKVCSGVRTLCIALLLTTAPIAIAKADCPASPGGANDLLVSFLAANSTQVAPALMHASTVKEGMLVYDDTDNALKLCDGDDWVEVGTDGLAAHGVAGSVQFSDGAGGLLSDNANLHWNDASNRLGIRTNTPNAALDVAGSIALNDNPLFLRAGTDNNWKIDAISPGITTSMLTGSVLGITTAANAGDGIAFGHAASAAVLELSSMNRIAYFSGNVGIGTTTPASKLQVAGGIQLADDAGVCPNGSNKVGTLKYVSNTLSICNTTGWAAIAAGSGATPAGNDGSIQFKSGSSFAADAAQLHWDDTNKRLGVGANGTLLAKLQVHGSASAGDITSLMLSQGTAATGDQNSLVFKVSTLYGAAIAMETRASGQGDLVFKTNTAGGTNLVEKMRITHDAKIGIGTAGPGAKLHVYGAGTNGGSALFEAGSWNSVRIKGVDGAGVQDSAFLKFEDAAGENTFIGLTGTTGANGGNVGDLRIGVSGERIRISKTTGNVGIGNVPLPRAKLHVAGGIKLADDADACPGASNIKLGTLKYVSDTLSICNTAGWTALASASSASSSGAAGYVQISDGSGAFASSGTSVHQPFFWNTANHRLGIGTTAPQSALDLGSGSGGRSLVWGGTTGANWYASIGTTYSSGDLILGTGIKLGTTSDVMEYSYTGNSGVGGIRFDANPGDTIFFNRAYAASTAGDSFDLAANTKMVIKASGNVGIGTATPSAFLQVGAGANLSTAGKIGGASDVRQVIRAPQPMIQLDCNSR